MILLVDQNGVRLDEPQHGGMWQQGPARPGQPCSSYVVEVLIVTSRSGLAIQLIGPAMIRAHQGLTPSATPGQFSTAVATYVEHRMHLTSRVPSHDD